MTDRPPRPVDEYVRAHAKQRCEDCLYWWPIVLWNKYDKEWMVDDGGCMVDPPVAIGGDNDSPPEWQQPRTRKDQVCSRHVKAEKKEQGTA